ncbi:MAG: glycosyltransferase family 39 protein [Myxococcales bacterium]|nr:glycosyltransferase family 39 protein [Myxococcales bacterium]
MQVDLRRLGLAVVALIAAHLAFLALVPPVALGADALEYHRLGARLAAGLSYSADGDPVSSMMPAYPLFIAAIYRVVGPHPWAVRVAQVLLFGVADAALALMVARRYGARSAAIAFVTIALLPAWFVYPGTLNAECLLFAVEVAFIFLALGVASARRPLVAAAAAGASAGALILVKPEFGIWLPLVALPSLRAGWRRVAAVLAVAALAATVVLSPWIARNALVFHRFIPLTTRTGHQLWLTGHRPELTEFADPGFNSALRRCNVPGDPKATDACLLHEALGTVASHPLYFAATSVRRVVRTLVGSHTEGFAGLQASFGDALHARKPGVVAAKGVLLAIDVLFIVVGAAGLVQLGRRRHEWYWLYLVGIKLAVHALMFGTPRYGLHLSPIFAIGWAALDCDAIPSAVNDRHGTDTSL